MTTKERVQQIAEQLSRAGEIRTRNMMGGYLVYLDEVLIGQINNDQLHIKITPAGEKFADKLPTAEPYPGAKPAFFVSSEVLEHADWLPELLTSTRDQLKK